MDFFDYKKETPSQTLIGAWIEQVGIDVVFNAKGTTYKTLKLKELNLDEKGKFEWLCKEPMLLKRPIVQKGKKVLAVGFDEEQYKKIKF